MNKLSDIEYEFLERILSSELDRMLAIDNSLQAPEEFRKLTTDARTQGFKELLDKLKTYRG